MSKRKNRSRKNLNENQRQDEKRPPQKFPFIIHSCILQGPDIFCSHTHGLNKIGHPEFLMDPLAFGPEGNAHRINYSYLFFNKPQNKHLLQDVLNGKIVKLTMKDLNPTRKDARPYVYCYRLVNPSFEALKLAYKTNIAPLPPTMQIVQIWVEGDNFAITDAYYAGGIKF